MKQLFIGFVLLLSSCLYAQLSDSLMIDGKYEKITQIKVENQKQIEKQILEEYINDLYEPEAFETPNLEQNKTLMNHYCIRKYLKQYGISRLNIQKNQYCSFYQIQDFLLNPLRKRYFNLDSNIISEAFLNTGVIIGQNYFQPLDSPYKLSHFEFYNRGIIKVVMKEYRHDHPGQAVSVNSIYLRRKKDSSYYFACIRRKYLLKDNYVKIENRMKPDLKETCELLNPQQSDFDYVHKMLYEDSLYYYFNSSRLTEPGIIDDEQYLIKYRKEDFEKAGVTSFPDISTRYNTPRFIVDEKIKLQGKYYNLVYNPENDSVIFTKSEYNIIKKQVNSSMQTFINYFEKMNKDKTLAIYSDLQGLILYDMKTQKETLIKAYEHFEFFYNIKFVENEKKIVFCEAGDHFVGNVYVYDIMNKQLLQLEAKSEEDLNYVTDDKIIKLYHNWSDDKSYLMVSDFYINTSVIELAAKFGEYMSHGIANNDFYVFTLFSDENGCAIYTLNLKTKKISNVNIALKGFASYVELLGMTQDNRLIFRANRDIYMTKKGMIK
ncbi:MAG TPA: hypothetical protein PK816_02635 [Candidatus Cloacimonadota bacterium]|nr:hypothetical protein [Candidatus Cloacimonadota bacterium]